MQDAADRSREIRQDGELTHALTQAVARPSDAELLSSLAVTTINRNADLNL
jgi:hypothetical protein